jgi:hypothetical protein
LGDTKYLLLRIWFLVVLSLSLGAVVIRLIWEITMTTSPASLWVILLVILTVVGIYALILYLLISPSLNKLKSRRVEVGVIAIFSIGLLGTVWHYLRFVTSPEAWAPLSLVIATLLTVAAIGGYVLIFWIIWALWKGKIG